MKTFVRVIRGQHIIQIASGLYINIGAAAVLRAPRFCLTNMHILFKYVLSRCGLYNIGAAESLITA